MGYWAKKREATRREETSTSAFKKELQDAGLPWVAENSKRYACIQAGDEAYVYSSVQGEGSATMGERGAAFLKGIVNPLSYAQFLREEGRKTEEARRLAWETAYRECAGVRATTNQPRITPKMFKLVPSSTLKYAPGEEPPPKAEPPNYLPLAALALVGLLIFRS